MYTAWEQPMLETILDSGKKEKNIEKWNPPYHLLF